VHSRRVIVKGVSGFCQSESTHHHANKRANVLPWRQYAALMKLLRKQQKYFLDEANVGAGLAYHVDAARSDRSGDVISKVEGIFLGHAELSVQ